jgi:choline-sulfatase
MRTPSAPRRLVLLALAASIPAACSKGSRSRETAPDAASPIAATTASSAAPRADVPPGAPAIDAPVHLADGSWNVLLLSVDSLRADMPWAGYARPVAPRLSALYARSIAYTHAYAASSFTSKSLGALLTGRYPSSLARTGGFFTRYLDPKDFFCTSFAAAGVPCVGGHAHAYFGRGQAGFDRGFSDWRLVPGIAFDYNTDPYVTSDKLTPMAIEMLGDAAAKGRPFFAWFHFMDPHDEYKPHPDGPRFGDTPRDRYDEEVHFTDEWLGKLLDYVDAQPWGKRTAVFVTADHGEAFGEHGMFKHAHELWEELVHVPMFVHVPGRPARAIDVPRGHVDLAPTFAEMMRVPTSALPGQSLVAELEGQDAAPRDVIVDLPEDEFNARRRALVSGTTKLIAFKNDLYFMLFDLAADPYEKNDLWRAQPDLAAAMLKRYRQASRAIREVEPTGGIPQH